MKVYAVLVEDAHKDPEIELFYYKECAIKRADDLAETSCEGADIDKTPIDGWLYNADCNCYNWQIRVTEQEIH